MSNIRWEYNKEEWWDKKKKKHINHLWYISVIDETEVDMGVEAEIWSVDNGPYNVNFYKGDTRSMPKKIKSFKFKKLPAAKKTVKAWMSKGVDEYVKRIKSIQSAIKRLSCNE